jgi:hypothetical protein
VPTADANIEKSHLVVWWFMCVCFIERVALLSEIRMSIA